MYAQVEKTKETESRAVANSVAQKKNINQNFSFNDNRPKTVAQRKQQEMVNKSPQANQPAQLMTMANYPVRRQLPIQMNGN